MAIPVEFINGLSGNNGLRRTLNVSPSDVQAACGFCSRSYILRMDLQFRRYVIAGELPLSPVVQEIYGAGSSIELTTKNRATSVTGNIGEGVLANIATKLLGASRWGGVVPLNVTSKAKCPDYHLDFNRKMPEPFSQVTGINGDTDFQWWPAEAKAVQSLRGTASAIKTALEQLGTYWYERSVYEPAIVGYGVISCFVYKGTSKAPLQLVRVHVITPRNQRQLMERILHYRGDTFDPELADRRIAFINELQDKSSLSRRALN